MPWDSYETKAPTDERVRHVERIDYSVMPSWFHPGQVRAWEEPRGGYDILAIIAGWQAGKALDVDTLIPTVDGFVRMGDLKAGDVVFGRDGVPCNVVAAHDAYHAKECFRVVFCDGAEIIADADHLWFAESWRQRRNRQRDEALGKVPRHSHCAYGQPVTTKKMASKVVGADGGAEWSMPLPSPAQYDSSQLPIDPYILGCWLGDGHTAQAAVTTEDQEVVDAFIGAGYSMTPTASQSSGKAKTYLIGEKDGPFRVFAKLLRGLGLIGNKHIPEIYLTGSVSQRLALVQGLMDTDGSCGTGVKAGACEYCSISKPLAEGFAELLRSLGIKARLKAHRSSLYGKDCGIRYRVMFRPHMQVFRLPRKAANVTPPSRPDVYARYVRRIEPVEPRMVRCITVDAHDSLYLAGRDYIVTHNTLAGMPWLLREIQERPDCTDFLVLSPTYPLMTKKVLPEVEKGLRGLAKKRTADRQFVFTKEGLKRMGRKKPVTIHLGHCQDPASLESATYGAVWWDEPGQCDEANHHVIMARLAVNKGRCLMTSRPYEFNWYKRLIWDKRGDPSSRIKVVPFRSCDNPAFPLDFYEARKQDMPGWLFSMRYDGIFTRPAGAVYDCFDPVVHCKVPWKMVPGEAEVVIGLDFGLVHMAALWAIRWLNERGEQCWHVIGTYLAGQRSPEEHVVAIMEQIRKSLSPLGVKWRIVRAVGGSWSEDNWRAQFAGAGLDIERPPYRLVEPGIQCLYRELKGGRVTIGPGLSKLRQEFEEYAFDVTDDGEVLDQIRDKARYHRLDAGRYIFSAEAPMTAEEERAANVQRRSWKREEE